ncbi:MAG: hypothetical protein SFX73_30895 [Kofleriaceae bacterium]|nr:hypothetical protein [Kofleriaceae bacterium]
MRALGDELVEAPLSGRKGIVVYAHAELPEVDPRGGGTENVTLTTRAMVPFALETSSGDVLVDGTEADVVFAPQRVPNRSKERERAFVVAHGRRAEVAAVATFRELVLVPGLRVAVHGMAIVEADDTTAERGYRDGVPTRTRLVAHPDYRISIGRPRD